MQNLKNLLENVAIIQSKYEDLAEYSGEHFNVFDILGVRSDELSHSSILTNLLNARGKHGQKEVFLKLFIDTIYQSYKDVESFEKIFNKLNNFNFSKSKAEKEIFTGRVNYDAELGGRIDILINDGKNNIIIENKIYAGDQPKQLIRYNEYDTNAPIFYLTLQGKDASKDSKGNLKNGEHYICISYQNNIVFWLEQCIKEMANKPIIRETLNQYLSLVKNLTNQSNNSKMSEEIINIMSKNIESSFEIYKNLDNLKKYLFISFVEKINLKLQGKLIIDFNPQQIGEVHSYVSIKNERWGNIKIFLYFNGKDFSNVILGVHEDIIDPKIKNLFDLRFKNLSFGKTQQPALNWYKLFSYERFNDINSSEFWEKINDEIFINSVCDDIQVLSDTIDKTLEFK